MKTAAASPAPYSIMLRHRTLSPTIYLSEVTRKPFALSQTFFLSSGGKSAILAKKNAPPRSGILLSMHVVLKTRHANPNILVRRFIVHVRSPNLSATRPQLLSLRGAATYYGLAPHTATRLHLLPRHSRVKTQASKLEEGYYSLPSLPRKVASHSEEEGKGKPRKGISTYIGRRADLYWSTHRPILLTRRTYIGQPADQYRFTPPHP